MQQERKENIWRKVNYFVPDIETNNRVSIIGVVAEDFEFNHSTKGGIRLFRTHVMTTRQGSDRKDYITVVAPYESIRGISAGEYVKIGGRISSYMHPAEGDRKHWLEMYVYVEEIETYEDNNRQVSNNDVFIRGYVTQPVHYTHNSQKKVTDVFLSVYRGRGTKDYVPCFAWEGLASKAAQFRYGEEVILRGKIRTRNYFKKDPKHANGGEYLERLEVYVSEFF